MSSHNKPDCKYLGPELGVVDAVLTYSPDHRRHQCMFPVNLSGMPNSVSVNPIIPAKCFGCAQYDPKTIEQIEAEEKQDHQKLLKNNLETLVNYGYKEEWTSFCETFDIELEWGDISKFVFEEKHKEHIFYHIEMLNRRLEK